MYRLSYLAPLALALGLAFAAVLPSQVQAQQTAAPVEIVVGGVNYSVQFDFFAGSGGTSFDESRTLIEASPWWGSSTLAQSFLLAYRSELLPSFPFDNDFAGAGTIDNLLFSYATDETTNDLWALADTGSTSQSIGVIDNSFGFPNNFYAYGSVVVPEIDGNALAQAAIILLALFLVLRGRRQATV